MALGSGAARRKLLARGARTHGTSHASVRAMDPYISSELIAKLRQEQRSLRKTIRGLEGAAKRADVAGVISQLRELGALYKSHERLVGALLEAVEPDQPHQVPEQE
jgi:hypothetical protein